MFINMRVNVVVLVMFGLCMIGGVRYVWAGNSGDVYIVVYVYICAWVSVCVFVCVSVRVFVWICMVWIHWCVSDMCGVFAFMWVCGSMGMRVVLQIMKACMWVDMYVYNHVGFCSCVIVIWYGLCVCGW